MDPFISTYLWIYFTKPIHFYLHNLSSDKQNSSILLFQELDLQIWWSQMKQQNRSIFIYPPDVAEIPCNRMLSNEYP